MIDSDADCGLANGLENLYRVLLCSFQVQGFVGVLSCPLPETQRQVHSGSPPKCLRTRRSLLVVVCNDRIQILKGIIY